MFGAENQTHELYCLRNRIKSHVANTDQDITDFSADVDPPSDQEPLCCMCNCKGTLQAILQELRTMRRLMQTQKGQ